MTLTFCDNCVTMLPLVKNKANVLQTMTLAKISYYFTFWVQVRNKADLYKVLDDYNVGDKVQLKIRRGNEKLELSVVLEEKE